MGATSANSCSSATTSNSMAGTSCSFSSSVSIDKLLLEQGLRHNSLLSKVTKKRRLLKDQQVAAAGNILLPTGLQYNMQGCMSSLSNLALQQSPSAGTVTLVPKLLPEKRPRDRCADRTDLSGRDQSMPALQQNNIMAPAIPPPATGNYCQSLCTA